MCNDVEKKIILAMSKNSFKYEYEEYEKNNVVPYIKVPFIVAADKINKFLKVKTVSAIDSVNKSKERRRFLKERMEKENNKAK